MYHRVNADVDPLLYYHCSNYTDIDVNPLLHSIGRYRFRLILPTKLVH